VDGLVEVYVNGQRLESAAVATGSGRSGPLRKRQPFEVDMTAAARPGSNRLALRVDNRQITELSLGGILRPVMLIER
jgi:hypothetical protein